LYDLKFFCLPQLAPIQKFLTNLPFREELFYFYTNKNNLMKKSSVFVLLSAIMLVIASCSKEQMALNKLEGTWRYMKVSTFGITLDMAQMGYANATLQFSKCSAKKDPVCNGVISLSGQTVPFQYDMAKDGKSVTVTDATTTATYYIQKLDKSNLVYTTSYDTIINNTPVSASLEFTLEKL
jgi:hypothetical protein